MTRLRKSHVEALLADYDAAPVAALTTALRSAFDAPTMDWTGLLELAGLDDARRQQLLDHDQVALDAFAAELNEVREVAVRTPLSRPANADDCAPPSDRPHR